jgi:hypothetical protein
MPRKFARVVDIDTSITFYSLINYIFLSQRTEVSERINFDVYHLPWEPPTSYPDRYRSNNSINRITVVTNNRNNIGIPHVI